ncbi:MAG: sugar phosphate isomerase/epimerase family protein [Spirochaetaceae bacterium]|nr:sugar phosphate isomerase/epimerase family protein [Spirochaetaceae bacterium]
MVNMRLSCFGYIKDLDDIAAAGYDCAELHVREIMGFDEGDYRKALAKLKSCGIPAEVFDNPIPLDSRVADPAFDLKFYRGFLEKAADRCAEMGARYFVFGNGKARSLPGEGNFALPAVGVADAAAKFEEFFAMLLDIAAERNITVLIEPLGKKLSNIVNNLPEAAEFIKKFGRSNLKTFIDYRYMVELGRPLSDIALHESIIAHVHLDNPTTVFPERVVPRLDDGFDYAPFLDALKGICFKGIVSLEASVFKDFAVEIREGIGFFAAHGIRPYRA